MTRIEDDRTARYSSIIDPSVLRSASALIVGCGAIGRQLGLQLASIGVDTISLVDHDIITSTNLGTQGWSPSDLGEPKAHVLFKQMRHINPSLMGTAHANKWTGLPSVADPYFPTTPATTIFFCVDSIDTRAALAAAYPMNTFFDARMAALSLHVYSVTDASTYERYLSTIFPASEAAPIPCTARSTLFCASLAASLLCSQFVSHLRGMKPAFHVSGNLIDPSITVISE